MRIDRLRPAERDEEGFRVYNAGRDDEIAVGGRVIVTDLMVPPYRDGDNVLTGTVAEYRDVVYPFNLGTRSTATITLDDGRTVTDIDCWIDPLPNPDMDPQQPQDPQE